jgi:tetratricopeptide (TPR) repeat protein
MSQQLRRAAAALGIALLAGCATAPVARPTASAETEEFVFPRWPPGEVRPREAREIERAWHDLLAGNAAAAEKRLRKVLVDTPGLLPAETALAYARLRAGAHADAIRAFAGVLERRPDDVPALVGHGIALARGGNAEAALAAYARAAALDPASEAIRRRRGELRLQVTDTRVAAARSAAQGGDFDRAVEQYQLVLQAAPELSGVRLELAGVLADRGEVDAAIALLEADPSADRQVLLRVAELATQRGEHERALEVYRRILEADPRDEEAVAAARRVREAIEAEQMPPEYRLIIDSPTITRADLAALLMVKVRKLAQAPLGAGRVAIDISGSWARDHIIRALALDLVTVYPNHTFQPGATVRRADLARAVARALDILRYPAGPAPRLSDMSSNNVYYYPAARVVGAGLMDLGEDGAFQSWRPVSGREATDVIEGLVRLVGN